MSRLIASIDAQNAGQLSANLLHTFGSLAGVFAATPEAIKRAAGAPVSDLLITARQAIEVSLREKVLRAHCDVTNPAFRNYVRAKLQNLQDEVLLAIFLDGQGRLMAEEVLGAGNVCSLEISGRVLFRRALEVNAEGLLIAHNHPSGEAQPSTSDVNATKRLQTAAEALNIRFIDHLVVGNGKISSMRLGGFL